jgi:hypothetical protein
MYFLSILSSKESYDWSREWKGRLLLFLMMKKKQSLDASRAALASLALLRAGLVSLQISL